MQLSDDVIRGFEKARVFKASELHYHAAVIAVDSQRHFLQPFQGARRIEAGVCTSTEDCHKSLHYRNSQLSRYLDQLLMVLLAAIQVCMVCRTMVILVSTPLTFTAQRTGL